MAGSGEMITRATAGVGRRPLVRRVAAALSGATAVVYFMIGFGVVQVVDAAPADAPDLFGFGLSAGLAFALGAILLLAFDRRVLWVLGALFQVGVIAMYVVVSAERTPPFEVWGILIRVAQVFILGSLVYLAAQPPGRARQFDPPVAIDQGDPLREAS
jgi:hypothetical protein